MMKQSSKGIQGVYGIWATFNKYKVLYLMLVPGLLFYLIYKYMPLYGMLIAFKDYDLMKGILHSPWADPWYKHFKFFYDSPYFSQLLANTMLISIYKIFWGTVPSIFLAIMLHEGRFIRLNRIAQTLSFMPHFFSWVIIYGLSIAFLSETNGLFNRWLNDLGMSSIPFLSSLELFRGVIVAADAWKDLGWGAIIYLAAMSSIDPTLYEAARIDGAGRIRRIWHVTLPGIRNVFILLLVLKLGQIMDAGFEQIYVMYNARVYPVADIIDTWVFRVGLEQLNFSLATAVGLFKSIIGFILIIAANRLARRWGNGLW